jgi:hypothetical protein
MYLCADPIQSTGIYVFSEHYNIHNYEGLVGVTRRILFKMPFYIKKCLPIDRQLFPPIGNSVKSKSKIGPKS